MVERTTASILHADLDAFYASVEQRDRPELRGRPVLVGGGVVLAASYEAKRRGVRTPMNAGQAQRFCPDAVLVAPRMEAYEAASREVFAIFDDVTPIVEGISIDEAFLDVQGLLRLRGTPADIAEDLRARVRDDAGLPISVGVARTKFLAKVASAASKPDGLLVVEPDDEDAFLRPLPVERLWGVGPVTTERLHGRGIRTVGDVADLEEGALVAILGGAAGRQLHALAHNRDPRPVVVGRERKSVGAQHALGRGPHTRADVEADLLALVDRVARRLRASGRTGRTVNLGVRFDDQDRASRSRTLDAPTAAGEVLTTTARSLLDDVWPLVEQRGITLVGVSVGNLVDDAHEGVQLSLDLDGHDRSALDRAVDEVRERFGTGAIGRAVQVDRAEHTVVPTLPDRAPGAGPAPDRR